MEQQGKPEGDELLDEKEAAAILNVSVGTLQVWRSTRRYPLAYTKIGRAVRYKRSSLLHFIESRTVAA